MIQVRIHLDKKTTLFKTLNKKGFIDNQHDDTLFMWANIKPNIGELIGVDRDCVDNEKLQCYLDHRGRGNDIVLRIIDLYYKPHLMKNNSFMDIIHIRCVEENHYDWLFSK
jgi:hypothetical protein